MNSTATAFDTLDEAGNGHTADAPVETPATAGTRPAPTHISSGLATPAQIKLIYLTGTRDAHLTEEETEERSQEQYGRLPLHLTKQEASEFIDALKAAGLTRTR